MREKKCKNSHFWAFWAKKANFGPLLAKKGPFSNFWLKSENVTVYSFFSYFNTKNLKILMCGFSGKWARTYAQTNVGESKGPSTPSRDRKLDNLDVPIWRKVEEPHSFVILRGLKAIKNFSKIRLEHFCRLSMFYQTAKFQEKVMNGFWETALRTNRQTWLLRSPTTSWTRDQKSDNSGEPIWRKVGKPWFLSLFKRIKDD